MGDEPNLSQKPCKEVIEKLQRERLDGIDSWSYKSLDRALHLVANQLHAQRSHVVRELVQNADDNSYNDGVLPTLRFHLSASGLHIANNERGFTSEDVQALCDVCASRKCYATGRIGKKGIGFKSIFRCCTTPYIRSGGFSFRFRSASSNKNTNLTNVHDLSSIGCIIPEWVNDFPVEAFDDFETSIFLPVEASEISKELQQEICPEILLFLQRLQVIEYYYDGVLVSQLTRHLSRQGILRIEDTTRATTTVQFQLARRKAKCHMDKCLAHRRPEETEIILAFPLDLHGNLTAAGLQPVFAFLPIRTVGFRFIVHADFDVVASRNELVGDSPWNVWLCYQIAKTFRDAVLCELHSCELQSAAAWLAFIPSNDTVLPACLSDFSRHLTSLLRKCECMPVMDIKPFARPEDILLCDRLFADLFDALWVKAACDRYIISQDIDISQHRVALDLLGCDAQTDLALKRCLQLHIKLQACAKQPAWFADLYQYLGSHFLHSVQDLRDLRILLLDNGELTNIRAGPVFYLDATATNNPAIRPCFGVRILNAQSVPTDASSPVHKVLDALGAQKCSPEVILESIVLPMYSPDKLDELEDETIIEHLLYFQEAVCSAGGGTFHAEQLDTNRRRLIVECATKWFVRAWNHDHPNSCWVLPGTCYFNNDELQSLFSGVPDVWFVDPLYCKAGVSRETLHLLGVRCTPRLICAEPEHVPARQRSELAMELGLDIRDFGFTKEYYSVESFQLAPEVLSAAKDPDRATVLLQIFDKHWDEVKDDLSMVSVVNYDGGTTFSRPKHGLLLSPDKVRAQVVRVRPRTRTSRLHVLTSLRKMAVKTRLGIAYPVDSCYAHTPALLEFFGDDLPQLPFKLVSSEFQAALGVASELSVDALVSRLSQLSHHDEGGKPLSSCWAAASTLRAVGRIYGHLNLCCSDASVRARARSAFAKSPLVVAASIPFDAIPEKGAAVNWCCSADARWAGDTTITKDRLLVLQGSHPPELRSFFINVLGVPPRVGMEDMLYLLHAIARSGSPPSEANKHRIRRIHIELAQEISRSAGSAGSASAQTEDQKKRLDFLSRQALFLTCAGTFVVAGNRLFVPDDGDLVHELRESGNAVLSQILECDEAQAADLQPLAMFFCLPLLSERVHMQVAPDCLVGAQTHHIWTSRLRMAVHLCARLVYDSFPEYLDHEFWDDAVTQWCQLRQELQCIIVSQLMVVRSIEGVAGEPTRVKLDVFADYSHHRLLIDNHVIINGGGWLEVAAEVCHLFIARASGCRIQDLKHRVQLLLSASSMSEMHRLLDKGSLKMTRALPQDVVKRLLETSVQFQNGLQHVPLDADMQVPSDQLSSISALEGPCATDADVFTKRAPTGQMDDNTWNSWSSFMYQDTESYNAGLVGDAECSYFVSSQTQNESADEGNAPKGLQCRHEVADEFMPMYIEVPSASSNQDGTQDETSGIEGAGASITSRTSDPCSATTQHHAATCSGSQSSRWEHMDNTIVNNLTPTSSWQSKGSVEAVLSVAHAIYLDNKGADIMSKHIRRNLMECNLMALAQELRYSHHRISPAFSSGQHSGHNLRNTVDALNQGDVTPADLNIKGVFFQGHVVVLNNRRLWCLKEHDRHRVHAGQEPVVVPVTVFNLCPVTAKFMLAYTTMNEGQDVAFFPARYP